MSESWPQPDHRTPLRRWLLIAALPLALQLVVQAPVEPVFNGDSNRHVMTSVFFRDFLTDLPLGHPKQYAEQYYEQYPALGLLIWPPLFHGVVGALMTVFGTSVWVPRGFVLATFGLAVFCLHQISRRRMSADQSALVTVVFSAMPMVFLYSRHVMLEMPTLALCLLSVDRVDVWLRTQRLRNLYAAAVVAALAALTRFDAVMLLPTLVLLAVFEGHWKRLLNRHVPLAATVALIVLGPTYYVIWREMGDLHLRQAAESVSGTTSQILASGSLWFYPSKIPEQAGWAVAGLMIPGLIVAFRKQHRGAAGVFAALLIGTYLTFTPLAELRSRHAIYWLPALAYFSVLGAGVLSTRMASVVRKPAAGGSLLPVAILLALTAVATLKESVFCVTGYAQAATVILDQTSPGDTVFVDGWWDGNLTYQLRHHDPGRSRRVVRADRILYDFTNVPTVDFRQYVSSDCEILQAIADVAPASIVFEDPQPFGRIEISEQMRRLIMTTPELFPLRKVVPVSSTVPQARSFVLRIFDVDLVRLHAHIQHLNTVAKASP
ncbi:MAG: glycosyltransferase family 39 protein [Fuerstiella sp.]